MRAGVAVDNPAFIPEADYEGESGPRNANQKGAAGDYLYF